MGLMPNSGESMSGNKPQANILQQRLLQQQQQQHKQNQLASLLSQNRNITLQPIAPKTNLLQQQLQKKSTPPEPRPNLLQQQQQRQQKDDSVSYDWGKSWWKRLVTFSSIFTGLYQTRTSRWWWRWRWRKYHFSFFYLILTLYLFSMNPLILWNEKIDPLKLNPLENLCRSKFDSCHWWCVKIFDSCQFYIFQFRNFTDCQIDCLQSLSF